MGVPTHFSGLAIKTRAVADEATYTFKREHSGRVHIVPDLTADCTFTLPSAEDGLYYELVYAGTAADAQDWIINTAATDELFKGGLVHADTDAGSSGDEIVVVDADASDDDTMTILTPEAGTRLVMVSDGSHWYVSGVIASATVPTFA